MLQPANECAKLCEVTVTFYLIPNHSLLHYSLLLQMRTELLSFFLDNSLKSFDVVSRLPPEQSQHVLLLRISKASTGMNLGLQFTPQIFIWIQVRALCRPASNVHFGLLEVAPVQERHMFCWLLSSTQHKSLTATTQFWC